MPATVNDDVERLLQEALAAFSKAPTADALDRAYVDLVPPLEPYLDDDTLAAVTRAFNIRKKILRAAS